MNKLALIAVSAALSIAAAASSRTADAASLRTDTTISGDTVRLGDLFDDVMGKEDQPVGRAPSPGRRATYDATYLLRIPAPHRVVPPDLLAAGQPVRPGGRHPQQHGRERRHGPPRRRGRSGDQGAGRPAGRRSRQQAPGSTPADRSARYDEAGIHDLRSGPGPLLRRPGRSGRRTGTDPHRHHRPRRGADRSAGPDSPRQARRSDHRGRYRLHGSPPEPHRRRTAARDRRPDRPDAAPPDHENNPGGAPGLQQPQVVTKGSLVTMVLQQRSMTLTAQGKALEAGADGQVIRVVNTMSNRTVEAVVTGPNQVSVAKPGSIALN